MYQYSVCYQFAAFSGEPVRVVSRVGSTRKCLDLEESNRLKGDLEY